MALKRIAVYRNVEYFCNITRKIVEVVLILYKFFIVSYITKTDEKLVLCK